MSTIDRVHLAQQLEVEQRRFVETHPRSQALFERAQKSLLAGVPMIWMVKWAGAFPVFVTTGHGAHLFALNRGILMTPFHNMALISPYTSESDIDRHTVVFHEAVTSLGG